MKIQLVEVKGKDSAEFLHRITAGTVKGIPEGHGRPGLLLSGQSRMIAQFDVLRGGLDSFLLAAPEECVGNLTKGLEALHFAESLEILPLSRMVGLEIALHSRKPGDSFPVLFGDEIFWPSPVPGFAFSTKGSTQVNWDFERIAALVPWPPFEWDENTPALEAGMLPWIDRFKGCYPGQEVVELSLNVGHPPRVLIAVESELTMAQNAKIPWDRLEALVTSVAQQDGKFRAILRVPWSRKDFNPAGFRRLHSHW